MWGGGVVWGWGSWYWGAFWVPLESWNSSRAVPPIWQALVKTIPQLLVTLQAQLPFRLGKQEEMTQRQDTVRKVVFLLLGVYGGISTQSHIYGL